MAGLGFKDFAVGEVLTSSDVDGYLMQQTVMRFADSGARGSALGTAAGTGVALAEGMVSYLDDAGLQVYSGTEWAGVSAFAASTAITATDTSWTIPALSNPVVRVTVIGGGGGGGAAAVVGNGGAGGSSSFATSAGTATAAGGAGGRYSQSNQDGQPGTDGFASGNGGEGAKRTSAVSEGGSGRGGAITVAYYNLDGISTANVTVGGGGSGGASIGGDGGDGVVIFEYRPA